MAEKDFYKMTFREKMKFQGAKMKKIITLLALAVLGSGCALVAPNRVTSADKRGEFHEGMDFSEVMKIAGRGVSNHDDGYSEEVVGGSVYKTWRIHGKFVTPVNTVRIYEFKFKDDKLVSWSWSRE